MDEEKFLIWHDLEFCTFSEESASVDEKTVKQWKKGFIIFNERLFLIAMTLTCFSR